MRQGEGQLAGQEQWQLQGLLLMSLAVSWATAGLTMGVQGLSLR